MIDLKALKEEYDSAGGDYGYATNIQIHLMVAIAERLERIGDLLEKDEVSLTHEIDVDAIQKHIKNRLKKEKR